MIRFAAFTIPEMTSKLRGFSVASLVESPVFSPSSYMTQQDSLVERRASDLTLLHGRKEDSSGSDNPTRVEASLDVLEAGNITVDPSSGDDDLPGWNWRVADLCRILCSFLVPSGDVRSFASGMARSQDVPGLSGAYWELASRWIVNVLLGVFRDRKETSIEESEASQMLR